MGSAWQLPPTMKGYLMMDRSTVRAFAIERALDAEMVACSVAAHSPLHLSRIAVLRSFGAQIDKTATVYHGFQARGVRHLRIGPRTIIGDHAVLDARGGLSIGADVNLSTGVRIWTAQHDWNAPEFDYVKAPVRIGDRAWIGPGVIVLPGAVIGEGAVVGAGAVVKGEIPEFTLCAGVPARPLAQRRRDLTYRLSPRSRKTWVW